MKTKFLFLNNVYLVNYVMTRVSVSPSEFQVKLSHSKLRPSQLKSSHLTRASPTLPRTLQANMQKVLLSANQVQCMRNNENLFSTTDKIKCE